MELPSAYSLIWWCGFIFPYSHYLLFWCLSRDGLCKKGLDMLYIPILKRTLCNGWFNRDYTRFMEGLNFRVVWDVAVFTQDFLSCMRHTQTLSIPDVRILSTFNSVSPSLITMLFYSLCFFFCSFNNIMTNSLTCINPHTHSHWHIKMRRSWFCTQPSPANLAVSVLPCLQAQSIPSLKIA